MVGDVGPPALDTHEGFVSGRVQQLSREFGLAGLGCQKGGLIHKVAQLCATEARGLARQDCCVDCAVPGLVLHPQDNWSITIKMKIKIIKIKIITTMITIVIQIIIMITMIVMTKMLSTS